MKLLDQEQVKTQKSQRDEERMDRVRKLRDEETAAAKSLNETRESVEKESLRLEELLETHRLETSRKINDMTREVESLESRKREALKPLDAIAKALEEREETIRISEVGIESAESYLGIELEKTKAERHEYEVLEWELIADRKDLETRENKLVKDSADDLVRYNAMQTRLKIDREHLRKKFEEENAKLDEKITFIRKNNG